MALGRGRRRDHEHIVGFKMAAAPSDLRGTLGQYDDEEDEDWTAEAEAEANETLSDELITAPALIVDQLRVVETLVAGPFHLEIARCIDDDVVAMTRVMPGESCTPSEGIHVVHDEANRGRWRLVIGDESGWSSTVFDDAHSENGDDIDPSRWLGRTARVELSRRTRRVLIRPVPVHSRPHRQWVPPLIALSLLAALLLLAAALWW